MLVYYTTTIFYNQIHQIHPKLKLFNFLPFKSLFGNRISQQYQPNSSNCPSLRTTFSKKMSLAAFFWGLLKQFQLEARNLI